MASGNKKRIPLLIIIVLSTIFGIYFFLKAIQMSSSFSFLQGNPQDLNVDQNNKLPQEDNDSDNVSDIFQDKDPFQERCSVNKGSGTSVTSNTVCVK